MEILVQILFGWPAVIASLSLSVAGILMKRPPLLIVGAVLFVPFSYYLSGAPAVRWPGLLLPLFQAGAAYAAHRQKMPMAWMLVLPAFVVSAWLACLVLTQ